MGSRRSERGSSLEWVFSLYSEDDVISEFSEEMMEGGDLTHSGHSGVTSALNTSVGDKLARSSGGVHLVQGLFTIGRVCLYPVPCCVNMGWNGSLIGIGDDMIVVWIMGRGGVGDLNIPLRLHRLWGLFFFKLGGFELDFDFSFFSTFKGK